MKKLDLLLMYFCAVVAMSVLYAPQPISALFESELGISRQKAGLFITALMVPLAFAGIIYGYLLEKISIRSMLSGGFVLLGGAQIAFGISSSYAWMLNIRGFQGLILPVAMTGIMSYISQVSSRENVASAIGAYIGVTILGGFLGRFFSGFLSDYFGWRFYIIIVGVLCLLCAFLVYSKCQNITASLIRPRLKDICLVLSKRHNFLVYFMIFCLFFVFQAILNYIPFELTQILGEHNGTKTGMLYFAYSVGVLISFNVKGISKLLKSPQNAILSGVFIALISIYCFSFESYKGLFFAMFVLCVGNFIAHSTASGFVNKLADEHKGIANGLYISFYYLGGALGSFLPGFIYLYFGWISFLLCLGAVCALSLFSAVLLRLSAQKVEP